mgnify:CR=1 FL=1
MTTTTFKNLFIARQDKFSIILNAYNAKSSSKRTETMIFVDEDYKYLKEIAENVGLFKQNIFIPYDATAYIFVKEDIMNPECHDFSVWECKNGTIELKMCVIAYSSQDTVTFGSGWDAYTEWIQKMNDGFYPLTKVPAAYSRFYKAA